MAAYLEFRQCAFDAPFALDALATGSAGTWATVTASFLVVAHDDPEELDMDRVRVFNGDPKHRGSASPFSSGEACVFEGLSITALNRVLLSWSPCRHTPHHYSVYYQASATWDFASLGTKLKPDADYLSAEAGGNIPGHITNVIISDEAPWTRSFMARIMDATSTVWKLLGSLVCAVYDGSTGNGRPGGTVEAAVTIRRGHDERYETTVLTGDTGMVTTNTSWQLSIGYVKNINRQTSVLIDRIADLPLEHSGQVMRDGPRGRTHYAPSALGSVHDRLSVLARFGGLYWFWGADTSYDGNRGNAALYQLNKWCELGTLLELHDVSSQEGLSSRQEHWRGRITSVNHPNMSRKSDADNIVITFEVEETINPAQMYGFWAITAINHSTRTIEIDGDWSDLLVEDSKIAVRDSSNNDNVYAVSTATYDPVSGRTEIVTKNALVDSTIDGRVELWDRP